MDAVQAKNETYSDRYGYHRHKCRDCGTIWEHANSCANQDAPHRCPDCGEESWGRYDGPSPPKYGPYIA